MSDIKGETPVRTQLPAQANVDDFLIKIADGADETKLGSVDSNGSLKSRIADPSGAVVTSQVSGAQQALDVGINVAGVQVDPRSIRPLTSADVVTAAQGAPNTAANGWPVKPTDGTNSQSFTAAGEAKVDITQPLPAGSNNIGSVNQGTSPWITQDNSDGSVTPGTVATKSSLAGGQFNTSLPTLTAAQQAALQLTARGELITQQDIGGSPISATNPMPVSFSAAPIGTPVNDYKKVTALAVAATDNHDYAITSGKTFQGKKVWVSGSGLIKAEVQVSPDGLAFTTLWVGWNSASTPNISIDMDQMVFLESGLGSLIRVIVTNEDKKPSDCYSTISGLEVP
jgi:hypothetical protein